ncbi:hypothetical protein F4778DRAFT_648835 [Xylariomycetidae sp. FL2044]|nr:hypothetical protein F4778DRAFT_648835 [Xylariomycetidae sp. FL2044]
MATPITDAFDPSQAESNAALIYIPCFIFLIVAPLVVGLRIGSRMRKASKLGPDDYMILVSLAFAIASDVIMIIGCQYGYGRHEHSLSRDQIRDAYKSFFLCQITYKTSINITKMSILLLYLRIFGAIRWFRWTTSILLACIASYCIAIALVTIFQCTPISAAYDHLVQGKCINNARFWFANAAFSIITDVIILVLPMPLVYKLQVTRVQKVALTMVFALGIFVVITACLRTSTLDIQATSPDRLYDVSSTMWTIIEMNVAIVCACLPQIRPLIAKLFPKLLPAHYHSGGAPEKGPYLHGHPARHSQPDDGRRPRFHTQAGPSVADARKPETSSEEYILREDRPVQMPKAVQYRVEYSRQGTTPQVI